MLSCQILTSEVQVPQPEELLEVRGSASSYDRKTGPSGELGKPLPRRTGWSGSHQPCHTPWGLLDHPSSHRHRAPTSSPKKCWQEPQPGFLWPCRRPGAARGLGPQWPRKRKWGRAGLRRGGPAQSPRPSLRPPRQGDRSTAAEPTVNPHAQAGPPGRPLCPPAGSQELSLCWRSPTCRPPPSADRALWRRPAAALPSTCPAQRGTRGLRDASLTGRQACLPPTPASPSPRARRPGPWLSPPSLLLLPGISPGRLSQALPNSQHLLTQLRCQDLCLCPAPGPGKQGKGGMDGWTDG